MTAEDAGRISGADHPRLIECAFPLKQASLDSVHEKNVRHGHISTLHIWPARRPLAACRAALIATLLPDPGTPEGRQELCEKIGGRVVKRTERKRMPDGSVVEREKEETEGGILHWGRETENRELLGWFREEIRKAYGGRAPRVLDPFAGGGAIPLEAMRLGCEATAVDINPVAWFILKCTLEYPQQLAGKTQPLPEFILGNEPFMDALYKAHPHLVGRTKKTRKQAEAEAGMFPQLVREDSGRAPKVDLAWHVRAWGQWVREHARQELAAVYPTYAEFEPLDLKHPKPFEPQPMRLLSLTDDATPDMGALNAYLSKEYLSDKRNPRWVAKPTVAYLWARTVRCKSCRAALPLLKTCWLCRKDRKRVRLTMAPNPDKTGVVFAVESRVPVKGGNAAQKREHDRRLGAGTMSRSGARCPCCGAIMTMEDIRVEGRAGRLGAVMTAVVVEGQSGKEYRLPTEHECQTAEISEETLAKLFEGIPFGMPTEPLPGAEALGFRVPLYGFDQWKKLFTPRQLLALGTFVKWTRETCPPLPFSQGIIMGLACAVSRLADRSSTVATWQTDPEKIRNTFARFALPITWDFCEVMPWADASGGYLQGIEWIAEVFAHLAAAQADGSVGHANMMSAVETEARDLDVILTDPPYYDAIPYSDCMDFFYVWLRRTLNGRSEDLSTAFTAPLSPKWSHDANDGELIDDASRHGGDRARSRQAYEDGMARAFQACSSALHESGRLVIVFAHKHPDAWETLVSAIIRAGFTVDGAWPIMTERAARTRSLSSAALSSSVWLVCKKRPDTARPGWDNQVLKEMRQNIHDRLREYWDSGIRGPDFVWAATGPAMEAYSRHPVVKKANEQNQVLPVNEFLTHVRRMVVDFVVGRVLSGDQAEDADAAAVDRLDEPTAYYLLHRHDFGLDEAPAGACILYAISCGISDRELASTWDLIGFTKGMAKDTEADEEEADADGEAEEDSGSKVRLKTWVQRKGKSLGYEAPGGKPVPLIDRVHCLMHLWRCGDLVKVDDYLDENGLRRQELFRRLLQSLIELSPRGSEERSLLESISNHVQARGAVTVEAPILFSNGAPNRGDG